GPEGHGGRDGLQAVAGGVRREDRPGGEGGRLLRLRRRPGHPQGDGRDRPTQVRPRRSRVRPGSGGPGGLSGPGRPRRPRRPGPPPPTLRPPRPPGRLPRPAPRGRRGGRGGSAGAPDRLTVPPAGRRPAGPLHVPRARAGAGGATTRGGGWTGEGVVVPGSFG